MKRLVATVFLFLAFPLISFAVDGTFLIPSWQNPSPSASYLFSNHVVVNGTWQLPPDWAANIYVYEDATVDPATGALLTSGTQKTDSYSSTTVLQYYSITNPSTTASSSGTFAFDIGPQPDGAHNIYIKFVGGEKCAVNTQLNSQYNTTAYQPTCTITTDNAAFNLLWPARNFTVQVPPYPRLVITPSTDPALNFSNVVFGSTQTMPFYVSNTGGQTLTGSISSGLSTPFSCTPSCAYTLNPGDAPTLINITFAPLIPNASYDQTIQFSCNGTGPVSNGCDGVPDGQTAFQSRHIIGNSVTNSIAPQLTVTPNPINYGTVNLGVGTNDKIVTITNSGGGILNGTITFNTTEYTCVGNPSCAYSLFANQSINITVRYTPVTTGVHADSASFTGGTGLIVPINSNVNGQPILSLYNSSINFGTNINVGTCVDKTTYIRNSGAGFLSGGATNPPIVISPPSGTPPGFSCISASCNYNNLTNTGGWTLVTFRFCPTSGLSTSTVATFTNTDNPPMGGSLTLLGQGNISPIGTFGTGNTLNFGSTLISTTQTKNITIWNTGPAGTFINGSLSNSIPPEYACVSVIDSLGNPHLCTDPYSVNGGTSWTYTFGFTPSAVQLYTGSVTFPNVGTVNFTGNGVQPDFEMSYSGSPLTTCPGTTCVTDNTQPQPLTDNIGQTTFGGSLSVQNKTFYLYINNKGSGANVNYSFPNTPHFFCTAGSFCASSLSPGTDRVISYEFRPDVATSFSEPLVVTYDYGGSPMTATLVLQGSSVSSPYLSVSPLANIPLGNIPVGGTATATFTVTNYGATPLDYNVTIPTIGAGMPTSGLLYHWTFDNADIDWITHKITDVTGNGNVGFLPGPISATGKIAEALNFTTRGGVTIPKVNGLTTGNTPHTISAWVKITSLTSQRQWMLMLGNYAGGNEHWLLNSNGTTAFGVWSGAQVQPSLPVGTWVHVATTFDGTTLKSYVNGVLTQSIPASFNLGTAGVGVPLYIGLRSIATYPTEYDFNGTLDDIRVYNTALNAGEIAQVYGNTYPQTASLVEWLKFDDATMAWSQLKAYDSSGKGNDGTLSSVPTTVPGKIGDALDFSGIYSNEVTTSNYITNPVDFTLSAWFKTTSASGKKIIGFEDSKFSVSNSYDRHIYMGTDGKIRFGVYDGSTKIITSLNTLSDGAWHQAVGTHASDGTTKLYIDGVLQGTVISGPLQNYSGYWRIGGYKMGWPNGVDGHFVGDIDDVLIYNRPLSPSEVSDLYGSGVAVGMSAFTCVNGCSFTGLPPMGAQNVDITFTPTQAMGYIAYPMFSSTNGGGTVSYPAAPYPSISGTGVYNPVISVNPTTVGFPDTNQGLASQQVITIHNGGLGNLSGSVSPVKTPGLDFYCLSGCNFNVPANGDWPVTIEFAPQSTGVASGVITINSNGINSTYLNGPAGQALVNVFGIGTFAPIIDIRGGDTNYGPVVIGKYKDQTFTIKNTGSVDLGSGVFMITGPFTCVNPVDPSDGLCHYNITAGAQVNITVRFSPTVVGPASGAVWLSGVPLARFFVSGSGVSPTVKFIEQ